MKRTDYINWDEYFMGIAILSAERSKDNSTQVGACIVNSDKKIVSVGYNGMPTGCCDDDMPWERSADSALDTKYPFVCHAELNAILNSNIGNLCGCTLYVTLFPCNECAKAIIQSGIKRVVYYDNKYADTDGVKASQILFEKCGVQTEAYKKTGKTISINV
ncbi:MAG: dCMP deaminase family protein [Ruminococcus sp.]|nr:dCMP deaminase family protein [Ruminococcus sp.]